MTSRFTDNNLKNTSFLHANKNGNVPLSSKNLVEFYTMLSNGSGPSEVKEPNQPRSGCGTTKVNALYSPSPYSRVDKRFDSDNKSEKPSETRLEYAGHIGLDRGGGKKISKSIENLLKEFTGHGTTVSAVKKNASPAIDNVNKSESVPLKNKNNLTENRDEANVETRVNATLFNQQPINEPIYRLEDEEVVYRDKTRNKTNRQSNEQTKPPEDTVILRNKIRNFAERQNSSETGGSKDEPEKAGYLKSPNRLGNITSRFTNIPKPTITAPKPSFVSHVSKTDLIGKDSMIRVDTGGQTGMGEQRWKQKFDESERKRRELLSQNEKNSRELVKATRRCEQLQLENESIQKQLSEKNQQLEKLRNASKDFYIEYDVLKNKYDVETDAYRKAIQQSSKWYQENNKLRRKSAVLTQRIHQFTTVEIDDDVVDNVSDNVSDDASDSEIETLRKTIQELSEQVARLKTDLQASKLQEFEATEASINLTQELELERRKRAEFEAELERVRSQNEHINRVSKMVVSEVTHLKHAAERERENVVHLRHEAEAAKKERNILAHQSAVLMNDLLPNDESETLRFYKLMAEIERLKGELEDQKNTFEQQLFELQEKLEMNDMEGQIEVLEEKLKLVEGELQAAIERAETAEKALESKFTAPMAPPPPPPPPLPPMMPPPPPMPNLTMNKPFKLKTVKHQNSAVEDMEELLGIDPLKKPTNATPCAIDDVISQIKGGKFQLKSTDKVETKKPKEEPAAVREMLNVLGTLRRRQRTTRASIDMSK